MNLTAIILGVGALVFGYYSIRNTRKLSTVLLAMFGIAIEITGIVRGLA